MNVQNRIKRGLSKPESIEYVRRLLEQEADEADFVTRTELAEVVCEEFGFQDPAGKYQLGGCLKGLRELEAQGWFQLPAPQTRKSAPSPRRLSQGVEQPQAVPAEVGDVVGLELILVQQESQMRIWNELMIREHPQGATRPDTRFGRLFPLTQSSSRGGADIPNIPRRFRS